MKLSPIVERLKGAGLRRVYGALELAGLEKQPGSLPQYFVVPEGSDASPNDSTGIHAQLVTSTFMVVAMIDGAARREDSVSEGIADQEQLLIDALAGWTPAEASRACDFAGARLLSVGGSTVSWGVRFRTARRIRKAAE
jgi:hypothetical protein